jgi:hypothetical protein
MTDTATRPLPVDDAAEQALLGAMLLNRDAIDAAANVAPSHYAKPAHGHIHAAIIDLAEHGDPSDPTTVAGRLTEAGLIDDIGGPSYLVTLQAACPATSNAGRYAATVRELGDLRRAMYEAQETIEAGYARDTNSARLHAEAAAQHLETAQAGRRAQPIGQVLDDWCDSKANPETAATISTGFYDLDKILGGGLRPRPARRRRRPTSMGKTAFGGQLALNAAAAGLVTLVCSPRWPRSSSPTAGSPRPHASTPHHPDRHHHPEGLATRHTAIGELSNSPSGSTTATTSPSPTSAPPPARSRQPPQLIIVDYIQLLKASATPRQPPGRSRRHLVGGLKRSPAASRSRSSRSRSSTVPPRPLRQAAPARPTSASQGRSRTTPTSSSASTATSTTTATPRTRRPRSDRPEATLRAPTTWQSHGKAMANR